jgi:hypothetical protein
LPRATGQQAFPILPSAPNEFFGKAWGLSITFTRDAKDVVNGLVPHQTGDHAAAKLRAAERPPELREVALDTAALGEYVGRHRARFGVLEIVLTSNHLEARITGQPAFRIFANSNDQFLYTIVDARLDVERDAEGRSWRWSCTETEAVDARTVWLLTVEVRR